MAGFLLAVTMSILSLNTNAIFNAIGGGSPLSIINSVLGSSYVIRYNDTSDVALEFSGMASIQPGGRASITNAPVEAGKYQSINKVREPRRVRCAIVITGLTGYSGSIPDIFSFTLTSQSDALRTIQVMLRTTRVYDIETPKETLESFDLVDYSYDVDSQHGITMLTVYLEFQEVIQQMEVILSGPQSEDKPTTDAKSNGITGVGGVVKQGGVKPSNVDELSKSWSSLKNSVGSLVDNVEKGISTTFQSALTTVKESAAGVANGATQKATVLVKQINKAIT